MKLLIQIKKMEQQVVEYGYFPGNEKSKKMQEKLVYRGEGVRRKNSYVWLLNNLDVTGHP